MGGTGSRVFHRSVPGGGGGPAGVVVDDLEAERFELADEVFESAVVVEEGLVVVELFF